MIRFAFCWRKGSTVPFLLFEKSFGCLFQTVQSWKWWDDNHKCTFIFWWLNHQPAQTADSSTPGVRRSLFSLARMAYTRAGGWSVAWRSVESIQMGSKKSSPNFMEPMVTLKWRNQWFWVPQFQTPNILVGGFQYSNLRTDAKRYALPLE